MKHNETQCVYIAADHDELLFQQYLRKYLYGFVNFTHLTHSHKVEKYNVIYQIEEGDFCLKYKVVNMKYDIKTEIII